MSSFKIISYHLFIQLYLSFKPQKLGKLSILNDSLNAIKVWMANNLLQLNTDKAGHLIIAPERIIAWIRQWLGSFSSNIKANTEKLGYIFDQSLKFDAYIKSLNHSCFSFKNYWCHKSTKSNEDASPCLHLLWFRLL